MTNRELVINLVNRLPEDTPLEGYLEKLEAIAGVEKGSTERRRHEGINVGEVRELLNQWAKQ